jgi:hypothetical protein
MAYTTFLSNISGATDMFISGEYIYVLGTNSITKSILDGSILPDIITYGLSSPSCLVGNDTYMFVYNSGNDTITKIYTQTGVSDNNNFVLDINDDLYASQLAIYENYLYISSDRGIIYRVDLNFYSGNKEVWLTQDITRAISDIVIIDGFMYISQRFPGVDESNIYKIDMSDDTKTLQPFVSNPQIRPISLCKINNFIYALNDYPTISQINMEGTVVSENWKSVNFTLNNIYPYGNTILVATGNDSIVQFTTLNSAPAPRPPTPVSDVCFPAGTPIQTDQGIVSIDKISPSIHTIHGESIDISKTVSRDTYLVEFKKNALGTNYPSKNTIMSKNHKVYYKGKMYKAKEFLEISDKVNKIAYSGEPLYNVLMKTHSTIMVNVMKCETLDPSCLVAHLCRAKHSNELRALVRKAMQQSNEKNKLKLMSTIHR